MGQCTCMAYRNRTIGLRELQRSRQVGESSAAFERPRTRADCERMPRPCPWLGCRYHLHADVRDNGGLRLHDRDVLPILQQAEHSCALDVAAEGPVSYNGIAEMLGVSHELIRLETDAALAKLTASCELTDTPLELPDTLYSRKPRNAEDETADILGLEAAPWMTNALCHWTTPSE